MNHFPHRDYSSCHPLRRPAITTFKTQEFYKAPVSYRVKGMVKRIVAVIVAVIDSPCGALFLSGVVGSPAEQLFIKLRSSLDILGRINTKLFAVEFQGIEVLRLKSTGLLICGDQLRSMVKLVAYNVLAKTTIGFAEQDMLVSNEVDDL